MLPFRPFDDFRQPPNSSCTSPLDADRRLRARDPLGASAACRSPGQSEIQVSLEHSSFLQSRHRGQDPGGSAELTRPSIDQNHLADKTANKKDCSVRTLYPECTMVVIQLRQPELSTKMREIRFVRWPIPKPPAVTPRAHESREAICPHEVHSQTQPPRPRSLSRARDEVLLTARRNTRRLVKFLCFASPPIASACLA
jgi:hypothetical protein